MANTDELAAKFNQEMSIEGVTNGFIYPLMNAISNMDSEKFNSTLDKLENEDVKSGLEKYKIDPLNDIFTTNLRDIKVGILPLMLSASLNRPQFTQALLDAGANPNAIDNNSMTALHHAAASYDGKAEAVQILIKAGAGHGTNTDGKTPLDLAIEHGHDDVGKALIDGGANDYNLGEDKTAPLHKAAQHGRLKIVQALIEEDQFADDINYQDKDDMTPLHFAVQHGHAEIAKTLLEADADPYAKNKSGITPLELAIEHEHVDVVKTLLDNGVDPNAKIYAGLPPLHQVAMHGRHKDIAKVLLDASANPNAKAEDWFGQRPLHFAARNGHTDIIQTLLEAEADADPNAKDKDDVTPLHNAVAETVQMLLDADADPNAKDTNDETPLHAAAARGEIEVAIALLEADADPDAKNHDGKTPIDLAIKNGHTGVAIAFDSKKAFDKRAATPEKSSPESDELELQTEAQNLLAALEQS